MLKEHNDKINTRYIYIK